MDFTCSSTISSLLASNILQKEDGIQNLNGESKMATIIGNIGPFDEKSEKFSDYDGRFQGYVAAIDISACLKP